MIKKQELIDYWKSSGIVSDEKIIRAFLDVPRELFISDKLEEQAYDDHPLPLGKDQTISQPTTVMIMTQALELKEGQKVLEVGAGSGWQAAIIGKVIGEKGKVITTEIIPELADFALDNIGKAKIKNVKVVEYDGSKGYSKEAPFNRIIVTAACPRIPQTLIDQLNENGILIAPVGPLLSGQEMVKLKRSKDGIGQESLGSFVFVPLKGEQGY